MGRRERAGALLAILGLAVVAGAVFGFSTDRAALNLGPGDSPFVSGFAPEHDVSDKVGWHWTTYDAAVDLPLEARGAALDVGLRYARMFGEEAVIDVRLSGIPVGSFRARGGEVRTTTVRAAAVRGPLTLGLIADSHERRNMGLRLDRLWVDVVAGPGLRLSRKAATVPLVAVGLLGLGVLTLGGGPLLAGAAMTSSGVAFAWLAHGDLFAAWRMTQGAPVMLLISSIVLFALGRALVRLGLLGDGSARTLGAASLVCMLFRLCLVSWPDFYYPDLMTHARVVETIRAEGPVFFAHPARALAEQGAWTKPVMGAVSSLPYAVVFHAPFALPAAWFGWSLDEVETAIKRMACLISVLPILLAGALAARFGLQPEAALALMVIPTYASRLSLALLPSLTGHAFDLVALLALAVAFRGEGRPERGGLVVAAAALLAGHLSYTSSVVNEGMFTGLLLLLMLARGKAGRNAAASIFAIEAVAALLALAFYYRHFVGDVFSLAGRMTGMTTGGPRVSVYPVESFWALLVERTGSYFGWVWTVPAVAAFILGGQARRLRQTAFLQAWVLSYCGLILLRARIPDVFRYGHETLFVAPLVALLAATSVIELARRGSVMRIAAWVLGIGVVAISLKEQLAAFAEQFANAL